MSLALGSSEISKVYLGSTEVSKAYLGDVLVYGGSSQAVSSYTIDQTGSYTTPTTMVRDVDASVINTIRSASHLYVGELVNGVLQCKQVSDADKTLYADGTSVTYTDTNDLFMKLPQFWWKIETLDANGDIVRISFTMTDPDDASWNEWEGNTFIGVYEASNVNDKLHSHSGVNLTGANMTDWNTYLENKGGTYNMITYESHRIMSLLLWGYYGRLDINNVAGRAKNPSPYTTGFCDGLGMTDTTGKVNTYGCNVWGLENLYGAFIERVANLYTLDANGTVAILGRHTNAVKYSSSQSPSLIERQIQIGPFSSTRTIMKMVFGQYCDLFPKEISSSNLSNQYFCTNGGTTNAASKIMVRTNGVAAWDNPQTCNFSLAINNGGYNSSTRLEYYGDYVII